MGYVPNHGDWCVKVYAFPTFCPACYRRVIYFECSCGSKIFLDPPDEGLHKDSCLGVPADSPFKSGNCLACGKELSNPESQWRGVGPICDKRDPPHAILLRTIRGEEVNATNEDGITRLHLLARRVGWFERLTTTERITFKAQNTLENLKDWLDKPRVNIRARDIGGETPLHYAAAEGALNAISALIAKGADVNDRDGKGNAPAHAAAATTNFEAVKKLAKHGADMSAMNNNGETPLHLAVSAETAAIVKMIDEGKQSNIAATGDMPEIVRLCESTINVPDISGATPLHYALSETTIKALLDCGANVGAHDLGRTPLSYAEEKIARMETDAQPEEDIITGEIINDPRKAHAREEIARLREAIIPLLKPGEK